VELDGHPIGKHEAQLAEHAKRIDQLEEDIRELLLFKSSNEEQLKTIFRMLSELKDMLSAYTIEMKTTLTELSRSLGSRLTSVEKDVRDVGNEGGKKAAARWETVLVEIIKYSVLFILGYIFIAKGMK
jgi:chromosome segregation ATPase